MKRKDIVTIAISVVVVIFAGALLYRQFAPPTSNSQIEVIVPRKVEPAFNQTQISELTNPALKDYTPDITPNFGDKQRVF